MFLAGEVTHGCVGNGPKDGIHLNANMFRNERLSGSESAAYREVRTYIAALDLLVVAQRAGNIQ